MKMKAVWCAAVLTFAAYSQVPGQGGGEIYMKAQRGLSATLNNGVALKIAAGDSFPFIGFEDSQSLAHLQFGGLSFWIRKGDAAIVPADAVQAAANQYRANAAAAAARMDGWPVYTGRQPDGTFAIDAGNPEWQDSGVRVKAGQHVLVIADPKDKMSNGWGRTDAAGYPHAEEPVGAVGVPVFHTGEDGAGFHWSAVVCAVGNKPGELDDQEREVEIGMRRGFTVDTDGTLYFIINDNRQPPKGGNGFDDNSGIVHLKIIVTDKDGAKSTGTAPADAQAPAASPQPQKEQ